MSKNLNLSVLMDFYGQLLTQKQLDALEYYYNEDLSLSEIADVMDISRQGARDFIKRGESLLIEYEEKLKLVNRFYDVLNNINGIKEIEEKLKGKYGDSKELENLRELIGKISKEI